jgi:hypothetical protein
MGCQGEKPGPEFDDEAAVDPPKAWSNSAMLTEVISEIRSIKFEPSAQTAQYQRVL